jgi:tetratricopeptide (TPR) repeat protein
MLLTVLAADAIWESSKEVLKLKGGEFLEKFGEKLFSRTKEGSLPPNHNLDHALRHSLGKSARVLAYAIHNPDLLPLSKLITDLNLASFADRLGEMVQNNILEKEPSDYWLSALIDESKRPDNFNDFSLDLLLVGNQMTNMTSLLHEHLDHRLRDYIQKEFISWSNRHVTGNPNKPACFDDYVLNGWPLSGGGGRKIAFYEVFCLFFREELKKNPLVFHAFTANTLADLKADIAKVLANAPSAEERTRLEKAIHKLEDFAGFKEFLDLQNEKLFASLTRIEAGITRLEAGQANLKAGVKQILESIDEIKRPQMARPVSETDDKIPPDIKAIIDEAGEIIVEGRYAEARQKLESARQLAEKQNCAPALLEIRIDFAETHILEGTDLVAARDALLSCLREIPKGRKKRREVLQLLGDAEIHLGNIDEAKSLLLETRQLAKEHANRFAEARALTGLSNAEEFLGNLKEANSLLDQAIELCRAEYREATDDKKPRVAMNLGASLSTKAILVRREARLAEAVVCLTKAEPFFKEAKSLDNLARTKMFKAEILFTEAKWEEGFDALTEALSIFESIGNITWQCRCLDKMARLYFVLENGKQALACLGKALYLLSSANRDDDAVPYLLKFAHLCKKHGINEKANEFVGKAKEVATKLNDDWLIAECLVAEARLQKRKEDENSRNELLSSALKHLESALSKCEVKGRRAELMCQIGDLHGWLRNLHEVRNWFERALHEYEEIGDIAGVCECLAHLAAVDREENLNDRAITNLERLLKISEGKPLYHVRAVAMNDLGALKMFQGETNTAKEFFEKAKALAEKHNFRDVLDALEMSRRHLDDAKQFQQPADSDFPTLIRELHNWCARYPKQRKAILPLWYYMHRATFWSICRSKLGVKLLICAKDSAAFKSVAETLRWHGDLFVWGISFAIRDKLFSDWIPWSMDLLIPKGMGMIAFKELPDNPDPQEFINAVGKAMGSDPYVLVPFSGPVKEFPDTKIMGFGKHRRLPPMIERLMLDTSAQQLIGENKICLPLGEGDEMASLHHVILVAWENGMIPVFQERLPHNDKIKAVFEGRLDLPSGNESSASTLKELWMKLLSSCQDAPQKTLADFSKGVTALSASAGDGKSLRIKIYLLRFQAGNKEAIHPAAVLVSH